MHIKELENSIGECNKFLKKDSLVHDHFSHSFSLTVLLTRFCVVIYNDRTLYSILTGHFNTLYANNPFRYYCVDRLFDFSEC